MGGTGYRKSMKETHPSKQKTLFEDTPIQNHKCWRCGTEEGKFVKIKVERFSQIQILVVCRGCYDEAINFPNGHFIKELLEEY